MSAGPGSIGGDGFVTGTGTDPLAGPENGPVIGLATLQAVCLDAQDVAVVADFWATVLGHEVRRHEEGHASLAGGSGPTLWVNPVPEPKTAKDRVHLDVQLVGDDPTPLVALGATVLREPGGDIDWWVLADPEGHEFCAFPPASTAEVFDNDADAESVAGTVGAPDAGPAAP